MEICESESTRLIEGMAQVAPFRFVDRVCYLDAGRVVTELHEKGVPERHVDATQIDAYALLEFAAQSSGLMLRSRRVPGTRSVIASFRKVENKTSCALRYPLRLESRMVSERWTLFEFEFDVYSASVVEPAMVGCIGIVMGRRDGTHRP